MSGEVERDRALQGFGAFLALTHTLTALSWTGNRDLGRLLDPGRPAICWPVFEACDAVRVLPAAFWDGFPWAYGLCGLVLAGLFGSRRVGPAMVGLALLSLVGLGVMLLDYRLRLNQHLMQDAVLLVFLALGDRRRTLRGLVAAFYVGSGTLKLNAEWLSGASVGQVPGIPDGWLPLACAWVVFLELVGVFGLFGPPWLAWLTLAQLALFHVASWGVVGFYYPLLMGCLLAVFPLTWRIPGPPVRRTWTPVAVLAVFAGLQVVPRLAPGDPALTGTGRLFALHMFDARVVCEAWVDVRRADGQEVRVEIPTDTGPVRMRCDPVIHRGVARQVCRAPGVVGVRLTLRSRRTTAPHLQPVLDGAIVCEP